MKALKMVIEPVWMFDLKKIISQGRAMALGDHRNIIKRTFLAVSKQTPSYKKRFVKITLENNSQDVRAAEKELQDKVRRIDLKGFVEGKACQIHRIGYFGGLDFVFLERNGFKRISRCGLMQTQQQNPSKEEARFA